MKKKQLSVTQTPEVLKEQLKEKKLSVMEMLRLKGGGRRRGRPGRWT